MVALGAGLDEDELEAVLKANPEELLARAARPPMTIV